MNVTNTREIAEESPAWSPDGRYLAYMVKPKTSSVYEIDIFDTLMRETKHLTTGTPKDKMNVGPVWSKDGKWIAYTQQQAKGTDSNIFVAEVATAESTLLTPTTIQIRLSGRTTSLAASLISLILSARTFPA